jgi:anti-sigma B factor antagonist
VFETIQASSPRLIDPPMGRVMTMCLDGEIGHDETADVLAMLTRLQGQGVVQVVLDLHDVSHFDFRGVRPLVAHAEALRALGGDLKLAGLSPYLFAIFRSAGANSAFDYYQQHTDAAAAFGPRLSLSR